MAATEQRVALVTGAGKGLGWATAQRLADDGMRVICLGRGENVIARAAELTSRGKDADSELVDVADVAAVKASVKRILERHGRVDVLVNNAGSGLLRNGRPPELDETTEEDWDSIIAVNLTAPFVFSQALLPQMCSNGWGRIINISSRAGRTGVPASDGPYSAAKAGLLGLTRFLAMKAGADGVTVNAIAAGRFGTDHANEVTSAIMAQSLAAIPLRRTGRPDELAATVSFLASDGGGYLTGATLDVNGGAFIG
jgi:3-oxoacyl-[acyl-carrier protein] reductase